MEIVAAEIGRGEGDAVAVAREPAPGTERFGGRGATHSLVPSGEMR